MIQSNIINARTMFELAEKEDIEMSKRNPIQTGFSKLDDMFDGGFDGGELVTIFGDSCSGKTTFTQHLILSFIAQRHKTLAISLEEKESKQFNNIGAIYDGKKRKKPMLKNSEEENKKIIENNMKRNIDMMNFIDGFLYSYKQNLGEMVEIKKLEYEINLAVKKRDIKVVVVDNATSVTSAGEGQVRQVEDLVKMLVNCANTLNILVVLIAHTKKIERWEMPQLNDLYGSSAYAQFSSACISVWRFHENAKFKVKKDAKEFVNTNCISVVKNRATGIHEQIWIEFIKDFNRYVEIELLQTVRIGEKYHEKVQINEPVLGENLINVGSILLKITGKRS